MMFCLEKPFAVQEGIKCNVLKAISQKDTLHYKGGSRYHFLSSSSIYDNSSFNTKWFNYLSIDIYV